MIKNHYQILGINRNAESKEIKQAYKKLAVKFHPDKNNGDKYFEERFKEIQESYEVLINTQKKTEYDRVYDSFYSNKQKENYNQSQSTYKNTSYSNYKETERKQEQKKKEEAEKSRVSNIKKNTELAFEDKAWIFLANFTIIGSIVGLFMFVKYRAEGYNKKSSQVCGISVLGVIVGLILTVIFALGNK
ncbi:MAG: DnaJ domain-containing protein [Urechidicola sp.]|nr:DnaJ domain-containing protein [Urechidicola sp.]